MRLREHRVKTIVRHRHQLRMQTEQMQILGFRVSVLNDPSAPFYSQIKF
jgi:hypothetical protein